MFNSVRNSLLLSGAQFIAGYVNTTVASLLGRVDKLYSVILFSSACFFLSKSGWNQLRQEGNTPCQKLKGAFKILGGVTGMACIAGGIYIQSQLESGVRQLEKAWNRMLWQRQQCTRTPWEEDVCEAQRTRFTNAFYQDDICDPALLTRFGCEPYRLQKENAMCWEDRNWTKNQIGTQYSVCDSKKGISHPVDAIEWARLLS